MRDITLRFDNREQFNAIVYDSGLFSLEEENGVLVDVIGCIMITRSQKTKDVQALIAVVFS